MGYIQATKFRIDLGEKNDCCEKQYYCPRKLFDDVEKTFGDKSFDIKLEKNEIIFKKDAQTENLDCKKYFLETKFPVQKNFKTVIIAGYVIDEVFEYGDSIGKKMIRLTYLNDYLIDNNFLIICSNKVIYTGTIYSLKEISSYKHLFIPQNAPEKILFDAIANNEINLISDGGNDW